jgi:hypothetical protein
MGEKTFCYEDIDKMTNGLLTFEFEGLFNINHAKN